MPQDIDKADRGRAKVQWYFSERGSVRGSAMDAFSGRGKNQHQGSYRDARPANFADEDQYQMTARDYALQRDTASPTRVNATESTRAKFSSVPSSSGSPGRFIGLWLVPGFPIALSITHPMQWLGNH